MLKFEDFKKKLSLKSVIVSRLYDLTQSEYTNSEIVKTTDKLNFCSSVTYYKQCNDNSNHKFFAGSKACEHRFCPICAKKRALKYMSILLPAFDTYMKQGCTVHMVTFTIKNTSTFIEGLETINKAYRYMTHDNKFYARVFDYLFLGGVKSLEIIRGKQDEETYHPHFHCLVIKNKFTRDFDILQEIWNNSLNVVCGTTNQKIGSVYIQQVKCKTNTTNKQTLSDVKTGILETVKYITKVEDIFDYEDKMLSDFITYSHGKRYISVFGNLKKLAKSMNESVDEKETKENIKKVCKYCGCSLSDLKTEFTDIVGQLDDLE